MRPSLFSAVTACPRWQHFYFQSCDRLRKDGEINQCRYQLTFENKPVATKLHDPRNMKSVMSLLWHSWVFEWAKKKRKQKLNSMSDAREKIDIFMRNSPQGRKFNRKFSVKSGKVHRCVKISMDEKYLQDKFTRKLNVYKWKSEIMKFLLKFSHYLIFFLRKIKY